MNRYPVWKYAIMVIALVVGVLYTLPNFFGEAPAVQVSAGKATVKVDETTRAKVEQALKSAGAGWSNVVQFTTYLVHSQDIAAFYRWREQNYPRMFPDGKYPPNTLLIIDRLVQEQFLIEVQTVAAL